MPATEKQLQHIIKEYGLGIDTITRLIEPVYVPRCPDCGIDLPTKLHWDGCSKAILSNKGGK